MTKLLSYAIAYGLMYAAYKLGGGAGLVALIGAFLLGHFCMWLHSMHAVIRSSRKLPPPPSEIAAAVGSVDASRQSLR